MGKKRKGPGKRFLFYYTGCLIICLLFIGCALNSGIRHKRRDHRWLENAENLMASGKYSAALKENEKVLELFPTTFPGDTACFHIGCIWAHPDNPEKNYEKARLYFNQLIRDYPASSLRFDARACAFLVSEAIQNYSMVKDLKP